MRKLVLNSSQTASLIEKKAKTINLVFKDMGVHLNEHIKIGSDFEIETDNIRVRKHKGKYYLLFIEEFNSVFLFYVDTENKLRTVYAGDIGNAVNSIYNNIGTGSVVRILKSSNKKAYRVASYSNGELNEIIPSTYRNKSSQSIKQVYMNMFESIQYAANLAKRGNGISYVVITQKGTELFRIG